MGHEISEAAPAIDGERFYRLFIMQWAVGCARAVEGNAILMQRRPTADEVEEMTWALAEQGRAVRACDYMLALGALQAIGRGIARFFLNYDVWMTPTVAEPPLPLGSFDPQPGNPLAGLYRAAAFVPFTPICNVTGQPAMSVPLFWNSDGLPVGTHFVGRFGDEATLFRLAAQLEAARPWAVRWPVIPVKADGS
jgi:amidase